jgi:hypothetical protein
MLSPIEIFHGTFNSIVVLINLIIGLRIASKYFKYKQKNLLYVGIAWFGIASTYLPSSIKFLFIITMNVYLPDATFFILNHALMPPFTLLWLYAFTDLLSMKKEKRIPFLIIIAIISIIFESIFFFYIITGDLEAIGTFTKVFTVDWTIFSMIYIFFFAIIALVTGLLFASQSLKVKNPELKLKGRLLMIAFISFILAALFEVIFPLTFGSIIVTRIIILSSAIEFYMGYILPDWTKKIFLKN